MSYHVVAYQGSLGTTVNTDIAALSDDVLTIINNHFVLRSQMNLIKAWAGSATLLRARLDSPTMRFYGNPYVRPLNVGVTPITNPPQLFGWEHPWTLPPGEEIAMQATSGIAMGTEPFFGLLWLQMQMNSIPAGTPYPVRFTSTTAATTLKWTTVPFTMEQSFPSGAFVMLNSEVQSTNGIAHRWIFDVQQERPGNLSITSLGNRNITDDYLFRMGAMGRFINTSLPRLQVLCNGADSAHEGYMWIVPSPGPLPLAA